MKVICQKSLLIDAISVVQKAIATRSTLPILEGILIEADESIQLTGYDLETGIEARIDADVISPGRIVVTSRMFGEIIRKLPDEVVTLETNDQMMISIDSGNSSFKIKGLPAEDYPKIPIVEDARQLKLSQNLLRSMIRQTIFAASKDESRPILNGVYVVSEGDQIRLVAIDGFRLALRQEVIGSELPDLQFIVPAKAIAEVGRVLQDVDDPVEIYPSHNHILFDTGSIKVVSRLIQGEYMKYQSILPQSAETRMTVSPADLLAAIERAALVINTEDRRFPVCLTSESDDQLVIKAKTDLGTAHEELPIQATGSTIDIDFNPRYFMDALRVIETEEVLIDFNGSLGPCVIRPTEGDQFSYLILPLRR